MATLEETRDFVIGEVRGKMSLVCDMLNTINERQQSFGLSLETLGERLNVLTKNTNDKNIVIEERLSRDYERINRIEAHKLKEPAQKRKFWIAALAHLTTAITSIAGVIYLFKTGTIK
jgi:hypothetical protein